LSERLRLEMTVLHPLFIERVLVCLHVGGDLWSRKVVFLFLDTSFHFTEFIYCCFPLIERSRVIIFGDINDRVIERLGRLRVHQSKSRKNSQYVEIDVVGEPGLFEKIFVRFVDDRFEPTDLLVL
jgi:hypothetical protein